MGQTTVLLSGPLAEPDQKKPQAVLEEHSVTQTLGEPGHDQDPGYQSTAALGL